MEFRLIELVRNNELYARRSGRYKNSFFKNRKWAEIGAELGISMERAKQRWSSLRDRYVKERKNKKQHFSNWKYYNHLTFLDENLPDIKTQQFVYLSNSAENETPNEVYIESSGISSNMQDLDPIQSPQMSTADIGKIEQYETVNSKCPQTFNNNSTSDSKIQIISEELSEFLKKSDNLNRKETTSLQHFFCAVAMDIEEANLPRRVVLDLKEKILKIVSDTIRENDEDGKYQSNCTILEGDRNQESISNDEHYN